MGYSGWDDGHYTSKVADKAARGVDTFAYDKDVKARAVHDPRAMKVHDKLNINGKMREARDSKEHPESTAIAVIFDVTGSMADKPAVMQKKLPQLMGLLLRKGYIKDPQICFGAIGDFFSDRVPLQIGQFESGIEMDEDITSFVLEGGGGGTYEESYQNALYFFAHKVSADCFEKRSKKGYLFVIGDEKPYPKSTKEELKELIGDDVQSDVPLETIVAAAKEKWNVFFIIPKGTNHYGDPALRNRWVGLLDQEHVIMLEDAEAVCETIGLAIGICEGTTTGDAIAADLKDAGASTAVVAAVTRGLDPLSKTAMVKAGTATGALAEASGRSTSTERL
jgi:hypothetical protein